MKDIIRFCSFAILMVFITFYMAYAQIGQEFEQQIDKILSKTQKTYLLNSTDNEKVFKIIDNFFNQHLEFNKAKEIKSKTRKASAKSRQLSKNIVILSEGIKKENAQLKEPITIWYESDHQKRSFKKDFRKPSQKSLPSEKVTELAQKFITSNKFYKTTSLDKISPHQVAARKLIKSNEKNEVDEKLTILQRAVFKRKFNGIEVINSKQVVDIHPETREILSYKSIKWTPVDETSGRSYSYLSKEEIVTHIDSVLHVSKNRNKIENIKLAYLQTDKMLVPVLAVRSKPIDISTENRPSEKRTLLVFLAKDLPKPEKDTKLRLPQKSK